MAIIAQSYCILLGVLFCINRQQLSLFDANHTLLLVSSPPTIDVMSDCIRGLFGIGRCRIKSPPRIIYTLGAFLLPLWLGLSLALRFSSQAFIDSRLCTNPAAEDLHLLYSVMSISSDMVVWGVLSSSVTGECLGYLVQRGVRIFRAQKGTSKLQGGLVAPWTRLKRRWYISVVLGALSTRSNTT